MKQNTVIMKNKVIMLCAAAAVLAACAKTEVTPPAPAGDQEITFLTAPVTKALDFETTNVFQSAAFYDVNNFAYDSTTAEEYIPASKVKYFTDAWRVASVANEDNPFKYYWPKDGGKLTFFSWSLGTNSLNFKYTTAPTVTITKDNGVKVTGYSSQSNDDFMVADIQKDQTANTSPAQYKTVGVPTLFKHKTSQVIIKVKTADDYTTEPFKQVFTLKEVSLLSFVEKGDYTQKNETWTTTGTVATSTYYQNSTGQTVTTTETEVPHKLTPASGSETDGVYLYIPQGFTSGTEKLQIKYTVSRMGTPTSSKDYTATIDMFKIMGGDAATGATATSFEAGKKYTITLTFTLGEILWDPAIEDWTDGTSGSGTIDSTNSTAS